MKDLLQRKDVQKEMEVERKQEIGASISAHEDVKKEIMDANGSIDEKKACMLLRSGDVKKRHAVLRILRMTLGLKRTLEIIRKAGLPDKIADETEEGKENKEGKEKKEEAKDKEQKKEEAQGNEKEKKEAKEETQDKGEGEKEEQEEGKEEGKEKKDEKGEKKEVSGKEAKEEKQEKGEGGKEKKEEAKEGEDEKGKEEAEEGKEEEVKKKDGEGKEEAKQEGKDDNKVKEEKQEPKGDKGVEKGSVPKLPPVMGNEFASRIWKSAFGKTPEEQKEECEQILQEFVAKIEQMKVTFATQADALIAQVDPQINQAKSKVRTALVQAQAKAEQGFGRARNMIEKSAMGVISRIDAIVVAKDKEISNLAQTKKAEFNGMVSGKKQSAQGAGNSAIAKLSGIFDTAVSEMRAVGVSGAQRARSIAASMAASYRGRGGDGIEGERNRARASAAEQVGNDYAKQIQEMAEKAATEVGGGKGNMPRLVQESLNSLLSSLDQMQTGVGSSFDSQAQEAKNALRENAEKIKQDVIKAKEEAKKKVNDSEAKTKREITARANAAFAEIEKAGAEGKKALLKAKEKGLTYIEEEKTKVFQAVSSMELPDPVKLKEGLDIAYQGIDSSQKSILEEISKGKEELNKSLDDTAIKEGERLSSVADQASQQVVQVSSQFEQGLSKMVNDAETSLTKFVGQVGQAMDKVKEEAGKKADEAINQFNTGIEQKGQQIKGELDKVKGDLQKKIDEALSQEPSKISEAAEREAQKIQPWWKKAIAIGISVFVAVVVFVAVAAFCVATLGTGALVAAIIAGAVAGAVGLFTKDTAMWVMRGGQSPFTAAYWKDNWKNYVSAVVMGGFSGGLGVLTAPLGAVLTGVISGLSLAGVDQVLDMVLKGESFNLVEFVVTAVTAGLLAGVAKSALPKVDKLFKPLTERINLKLWLGIKSLNPNLDPQRMDIILHQLKVGDKIPSDIIKRLANAIRGELLPDPDQKKKKQND